MSMTREEAIVVLEESKRQNEIMRDNPTTFWASHQMADGVKNAKRRIEAFEIALSALRPVSRERVEKVWSGCDFCNTADFGEFGFEITKHYAKICCALGSWRFPEKEQFLFCPKCGKPLTDEAVEMVMERWKEALE